MTAREALLASTYSFPGPPQCLTSVGCASPSHSPPPSPHVPELRHARSNQTLKNPLSSVFLILHRCSCLAPIVVLSFGFFNPAPDTGFELSCCESVVRTLIRCNQDVGRFEDGGQCWLQGGGCHCGGTVPCLRSSYHAIHRAEVSGHEDILGGLVHLRWPGMQAWYRHRRHPA